MTQSQSVALAMELHHNSVKGDLRLVTQIDETLVCTVQPVELVAPPTRDGQFPQGFQIMLRTAQQKPGSHFLFHLAKKDGKYVAKPRYKENLDSKPPVFVSMDTPVKLGLSLFEKGQNFEPQPFLGLRMVLQPRIKVGKASITVSIDGYDSHRMVKFGNVVSGAPLSFTISESWEAQSKQNPVEESLKLLVNGQQMPVIPANSRSYLAEQLRRLLVGLEEIADARLAKKAAKAAKEEIPAELAEAVVEAIEALPTKKFTRKPRKA